MKDRKRKGKATLLQEMKKNEEEEGSIRDYSSNDPAQVIGSGQP